MVPPGMGLAGVEACAGTVTQAPQARLAHRHSPEQNGILRDGWWAFGPPAFAGSHVCEAVEECEAGVRRSLGKGGLLRRVPPKC